MWMDLNNVLKFMTAAEFLATWDDSLVSFRMPDYVWQIESNDCDYVKSLDDEGLRNFAKLLKSKCDGSIPYGLLYAFEKYDVQIINELGIENLIHFYTRNVHPCTEWDLPKLKAELNDTGMSDELTAEPNKHYNKIHIAKRLTIPAHTSIETDFPVGGFYKEAANVYFSCSVHSPAQGESYQAYTVHNMGDEAVVLEHV